MSPPPSFSNQAVPCRPPPDQTHRGHCALASGARCLVSTTSRRRRPANELDPKLEPRRAPVKSRDLCRPPSSTRPRERIFGAAIPTKWCVYPCCCSPSAYAPQNAELFTLTYGALVVQLVKDYEDYEEVNTQLEKMCVRRFAACHAIEANQCPGGTTSAPV